MSSELQIEYSRMIGAWSDTMEGLFPAHSEDIEWMDVRKC